ncbi:MFS transporter [Leptolyngbya iicbica]|uniref:MFS transporter n=2 Tax=Cyanophyceae TaxID=3028117 RepID=A0A4Q7E001_9CYAN|nr:MFS transporter [Leptolyngbya sp. LK]RZM74438.1 MFS transporter [Leptolyngbya sp. LK]
MADRSQRLPWRFWIITLVAFINAVSFTIIIPVLYPYAKQFGLSDFQASLLTTAYAASQFIGTPILGRLSDRVGRKPLLILSLLGTVLANLMASLAPFAWFLFLARVLDGVTGGNNSIAQAIISDITNPEQRTRAFGIFGATFRLGFVAGPPLSYLAQVVPPLPGISSLGMSFMVSAAIALIATILCAVCLPETHQVCEQFELTWSDFKLGRIVRSLQNPRFGRTFLVTFLSGFTFTIFTFAFQPFFLNILGQTPGRLALIFAVFGIIGFMTQVFGLEPLRQRFNVVNILAFMLAARGICFLLIPTFPTIQAFVVITVVFAAVNSFPLPLIESILSLRSGPQEQGEVLGTNASFLSLSNAIGPAVAGALVSFGYGIPFWITGVLTIGVAWFALSLRESASAHST